MHYHVNWFQKTKKVVFNLLKTFYDVLDLIKVMFCISFTKYFLVYWLTLFLLSSGMTLTAERGHVWPRQY